MELNFEAHESEGREKGFMVPVGIASWTCEMDGAVNAVRRIARHGFQNVELWCNYAHLDPRLEEDVTMLGQVLREERLRPVSLHAPFEFRGEKTSTQDVWAAWEELMTTLVETADHLEVGFLVVHPVLVSRPPDLRGGEIIACHEQSLKRVARLAAGRGIRIALENLGRKNVPDFADPAEVVKLTQRLGEDNVGVCFDTGHCLVSGLDPIEEMDHCLPHVLSFHIHENDGLEDLHWVPGKGRIDWPRFFDKLHTVGYGGLLIMEIWGGQDADRVMEEARDFADQYSLRGVS
ncbi:MAG: sugar phosphate isomerase/epimerase family protein [Candidatus Methylomirabilales bacterium]